MAGPLRRALQRFGVRSIESGTPGTEGQPKDGPWHIIGQGWLPEAWGYTNFWQMDYDPIPGGGSAAVVEACIAAYAQTIAMCPGDQWRGLDNGGRERVTTTALSRLLKRPNDYQSRSDFLLDLASDLYRYGNTYALAQRNDRFEVEALHPFDPKQSRPVVRAGGEVFYELAGNEVIEGDRSLFGTLRLDRGRSIVAPARDVFHVKLEPEPGKPLVGIPPARHAAAAIAAQRSIGNQLTSVFSNMNRPVGVVETDQQPTSAQMTEFRNRFREAWAAQGPPLLSHGWKWKGVSMTAEDTQLAQIARLTQDEIFMVFGVPPAILGMTDKASFASTEALMTFWLSRGLGFAMNHIEVAFDAFFNLRGWPHEYVEFDESALLRVQMKDRIEALARGVQTAIYSPNEARRFEELPDKEGGDQIRVQQQQVPVDWGGFDVQPKPAAGTEPAPTPADDEEEDDELDDEKAVDVRNFVEMDLVGIFQEIVEP